MKALLRSELIKLVTTRTFYGLLAGAVLVVLLGTVSTIMGAEVRYLGGPLYRHPFYLLTSVNTGLFGLIFGIRSMTDEFRHGTIVTTLLARGDRTRILVAKLIAATIGGAAIGLVATIAMAASALMLSSVRDAGITASGSWAPMGGMVLAIALWAAIGVGVGAILRQQVAAIAGALIWVLVVENIGSGFMKEASRFLPGIAAHGLAHVAWTTPTLNAPAAAALLAGYLMLACVLGALSLTRRDVA